MSDTDQIVAVILAAGRGSRLLSLTDDRPKGLVSIAGKSLIDWQIQSLTAAGVESIIIVNGYRGEVFEHWGLRTIANPRWDKTNMVGSMMCALEQLEGPLIFSYSDILYHPNIVSKQLASEADFSVTYDVDWLDIWTSRFDDPLSDAESFKINKDGLIVEIGKKVDDISTIEGQFMGLFKVSSAGVDWIRDVLAEESHLQDKLDTTALLNVLINNKKPITGVPISGNWTEVDNQRDLEVAERMLATGQLNIGVQGGT